MVFQKQVRHCLRESFFTSMLKDTCITCSLNDKCCMCGGCLADRRTGMAVLSTREQRAAAALAQIGYCNPFLPERLALERTALGTAFRGSDQLLNLPPDADRMARDKGRPEATTVGGGQITADPARPAR